MVKENYSVVGITKKLGLQLIQTKEQLDKMNIGIAKETVIESTIMLNELEKEILELLYFTDDLHRDIKNITSLLSTIYRKIEDESYNELRNYKHNLRVAIETFKEHFEKIDQLVKGG